MPRFGQPRRSTHDLHPRQFQSGQQGPPGDAPAHGAGPDRQPRRRLLPGHDRHGLVGRRLPRKLPALFLRDEGVRAGGHDLRQGLHEEGAGKRPHRQEQLRQPAAGRALQGFRRRVQLRHGRQDRRERLRRAVLGAGGRDDRPLRPERPADADGRRHGDGLLQIGDRRGAVGRRPPRQPAAPRLCAEGERHRSRLRLDGHDPQGADERPLRSRELRQHARQHPVSQSRQGVRLRHRRDARSGPERPDGRAGDRHDGRLRLLRGPRADPADGGRQYRLLHRPDGVDHIRRRPDERPEALHLRADGVRLRYDLHRSGDDPAGADERRLGPDELRQHPGGRRLCGARLVLRLLRRRQRAGRQGGDLGRPPLGRDGRLHAELRQLPEGAGRQRDELLQIRLAGHPDGRRPRRRRPALRLRAQGLRHRPGHGDEERDQARADERHRRPGELRQHACTTGTCRSSRRRSTSPRRVRRPRPRRRNPWRTGRRQRRPMRASSRRGT